MFNDNGDGWETLQGIVRQLPYGPGLWESVRAWPNETVSQLNTIVQFVSFDCDGDWLVYVETLLPAMGELFIALLDFGWDDVARGFLRPSGIRARWKFRKGNKKGKAQRRKKSKFKFEIPEIGELIGKNLPLAGLVKGRKVGNAQRWFWRIDGWAQRVLWYWLVVDISKDFVYNWSTGILRHERCWMNQAGWFTGGPGLISFSPNGAPTSVGAPLPHRQGGAFPPAGVPLYVPPGRTGSVMLVLDGFRPFLGRVTSVGAWIETDSGEVVSPQYLVEEANLEDAVPLGFSKYQNLRSDGVWLIPKAVGYAKGEDVAIFEAGFVAAKWD